MPLAVIPVLLQALVELFKFLQTAEGQKTVETWRGNDAAFRNSLNEAGVWINRLFKGELLKP